MNHFAQGFSESTQVKTHREMRIEAYAAIKQSKLRGGTEAEKLLREADLATAESIAWEIYGDANDETPHETRLLISNVFFERGDLENALHYANRAIENEAGHAASITFKAVIEGAIQSQEPIEPSTPALEYLSAAAPTSKDVTKANSFNHLARPTIVAIEPEKPQEEPEDYVPAPQNLTFDAIIDYCNSFN